MTQYPTPDPDRGTRRAARMRSGPRRRGRRLVTLLLAILLVACSDEAPLPGEPLRFATRSLPDPVLNERYQESIVATGGLRPYEVRLEEGSLPPGLALQGGTLLGTPTREGRFEFTLAVSDANLASTFEEYAVTVRDVPVPRLTLDLPETEVRETTTLRLRVDEARGFRAARVRLSWASEGVRLVDDGVRAGRNDVHVFHEVREDGAAFDLAVLGSALDGGATLVEFDLETDGPVRLGMQVRAELLYAGRHHHLNRFEGVRPADEDAEDEAQREDAPDDEEPPEGEDDGAGDADDGDGDPAAEETP